jgi:exosortase
MAAHSPGWSAKCAGGTLAALLGVSFAECLAGLAQRWANEPDYSHGFFVPVFAAFLLWRRRDLRSPISIGGRWVGAGLVFASAVVRLASVRLNYTLLEPVALLPCLAGVALLIGGWGWLRWLWPAIAFLAFMIPLPGFVAGQLGGPMQRITTVCSTYLLQTCDIPATATGNVIWLTDGRIGVVEACNGMRMLVAFFAVTIGAALLMRGAFRQKALIVMSAPAIGLFANVVRITATGLVHEWISPEVADKVFHDFAGWLMMPMATMLLLLELYLLSRLLIAPIEGPVVHIGNERPRMAMTGTVRSAP